MPYPKRLLQEGEELSLDLQPHWWFFAKQIGAAIPLLVVLVIIIGEHAAHPNVKYAFYLWAALAVAFAVWLVIKYLDWRFTHFVLTNKRVVYRTGVIAKRGVEIPLARVNNINFNQTIWERMIGTGNLEIESAGRDGQSVFDHVRHPDGVQNEIYRMMEDDERVRASWSARGGSSGAPAATTAATSSQATVPEQIEQLARLRDQGVITHEEFDAKKAELLKRM